MIKVLIVDDSVVFRKILAEALSKNPKIRVAGTAENGREALAVIRKVKPHIVIMDVEMPVMGGLEALDEIKRQRLNVGVIMFSSLTVKGAETTLEALSRGAFDFVPKPTGSGAFSESVKRIKDELIPLIEAHASSVKPIAPRSPVSRATKTPGLVRPSTTVKSGVTETKRLSTSPSQKNLTLKKNLPEGHGDVTKSFDKSPVRRRKVAQRVEAVAIGVSTGGPNALNDVIPLLPANFRPPVFLVQHMPPVFTTQLAARLNSKSKINVVEAKDGDSVRGGTVYLAPGDFHLEVVSKKGGKIVKLTQGPKENSCRPAADVLFRSVAASYGSKCAGVIMTGMGKDGFEGIKLMKKQGAPIVAQDKDTCVVYGMPKFVIESGMADYVCPLDRLAFTIQELAGF